MSELLDRALFLVDTWSCSPMCLFGRNETCTCHCRGEHHGLLRPDVVTPAPDSLLGSVQAILERAGLT